MARKNVLQTLKDTQTETFRFGKELVFGCSLAKGVLVHLIKLSANGS